MTTAPAVRRVIPLTLGWETLPKSISVHGADPAIRLREPVPGVLVEVDGGWILLDTGYNTTLVRDPWLHRRFHGDPDFVAELAPCVPGEEPLLAALAMVGVDPGDVVAVALSHLHSDHAGGLRLFAPDVPVYCQRRELEYGLRPGPEPEAHGLWRINFDDPAIDWRLLDGDAELAPGLEAVATYGHTVGHQSFVVRLGDDAALAMDCPGYVFAFDAADLTENLEEELAVGSFIDCTPEVTIEAIRRLKAIAQQHGYRLLPGHDPHAWPAFAAEIGVPGP
ncbi:MAG: N-acyl homoserine lactone hydrolase [Acidimicrobiaceae bacterium]|nr:N-acyl homoserine lactone hydrolase [Acidimicrobiaceae bacterium]